MTPKHAKKSFTIVLAAAASIGLFPFLGTTANAAEGCYAGVGTKTIDTVVTNDGRAVITLAYDPNSQCAWAVITGVQGSQVWVDRRNPYQGMLGGVRVVDSSGYGGTDTWNDAGKEMRACGTSGSGTAIKCTIWY